MIRLFFRDLGNLKNGDLIKFNDTDYKTLSIVIEIKANFNKKKYYKMKDFIIKEYDEPEQENLYSVLTTTLEDDEYWNSIDIFKVGFK